MQIEQLAIKSMIEAMGNDIRQAFNVVQMWCTKAAGSGEAGRGVGTNAAVNTMISKVCGRNRDLFYRYIYISCESFSPPFDLLFSNTNNI